MKYVRDILLAYTWLSLSIVQLSLVEHVTGRHFALGLLVFIGVFVTALLFGMQIGEIWRKLRQ